MPTCVEHNAAIRKTTSRAEVCGRAWASCGPGGAPVAFSTGGKVLPWRPPPGLQEWHHPSITSEGNFGGGARGGQGCTGGGAFGTQSSGGHLSGKSGGLRFRASPFAGGVQLVGEASTDKENQTDGKGCGRVCGGSGCAPKPEGARRALHHLAGKRACEKRELRDCRGRWSPIGGRERGLPDGKVPRAHGRSSIFVGSPSDCCEDAATTNRVGVGSRQRSHTQDPSSKSRAQHFARRRIWKRYSCQKQSNDGCVGRSSTSSSSSSTPNKNARRASQGSNVCCDGGGDPVRRRRGDVHGPDVQDDHDENDAGRHGQERKEEESEASRPAGPGGFRQQCGRRRRELVVKLPRGKRNRGSRKVEVGHEGPPRSIPRENGTKNDEGNRSFRNGSISTSPLCPIHAGWKESNSRLLRVGPGRNSQAVAGEQASSSSVAGHQDAGRNGAVPHRRVLGGGFPPHRNRRTPLGPLGHSRSSGPQEAVHLHEIGGSNLDSITDQSAKRRGLVSEKEKHFQAGAEQEGRQQRKRGCHQRVNRFLRWPADDSAETPSGLGGAPEGMLVWLEWFISFLSKSSLPMGRYVTSTFPSCKPQASFRGSATADLFPCPPPFPWLRTKEVSVRHSRRQRQRWKVRRAIELWVNLMTVGLSSQALGCDVAPERGRFGWPLSKSQQTMVDFLKTLAASMCRLGDSSAGCGSRLPAASTRLEVLREQLVQEMNSVPYANVEKKFHEDGLTSDFSTTTALPVIADRLSLPAEVKDFDPCPYLSPLFRQIYETPDDFLLPPEEQPLAVKAKGTASRKELVRVFQRWDQLNRLHVCKSDEVSIHDRCELFAVFKDDEKDRQILHRKKRNKREHHHQGASKDLPHAVMLCQLPLEDRYVAASSVDDVKDFYHAYAASEARARSSPVGPSFHFAEISHLKACQDALREGKIRKGDMLACCFQGLGMGDHAAVDIAQESHVNLLKSFGGMRDAETLMYRRPLPLPPTGFYEGIMIDDHLGIQLLERKSSVKATLEQPGRDKEAFDLAQEAYQHGNLVAHEKKKMRRSLDVKAWGAELEGWQGLVGPVRSRLFKLAKLSVSVAAPGPVDEKIVESITGLWAFCAQFRRPMFSFLHALYHQQSPGSSSSPFRLSREARNELLVLACLSPLCITDVTTIPDEYIYCVDASPSGAGACRSLVGRGVSRELWRRGDKYGFRTPLLSSVQASLKGSGWDDEIFEDTFGNNQEANSSTNLLGDSSSSLTSFEERAFLEARMQGLLVPSSVPGVLSEGPFDFLEVYSGCSRLSLAMKKKGFSVLPPIELKQGFDMCERPLFLALLGLVRIGRIRFIWVAPPCTTFSLARTPKLRSLKVPWGFDLLHPKVVAGNLHAGQALLLCLVQFLVGGFFGAEQPAWGFMRALPLWKLLVLLGSDEFLFDWCRFKCLFKKTTRLLSNFGPMKTLGKRCNHKFRHSKLEGSATTLAGAYSACFCDMFADTCFNNKNLLEQGSVGSENFFEENFQSDVTPLDKPPMDREEKRCSSSQVNPRVDELLGSLVTREGKAKGGSPLWAVQLSEGLVWKTIMQYTFRQVEHINLQECKARRSLLKRLKQGRRVVICQDSRVNLGALGKGRSPSSALNRIMRSEAPWLLGKNLHISGVHFPTWSLRADAPSRNFSVPDPRTELPPWFFVLRHDPFKGKMLMDQQEGLPRAWNRWWLLAGSLLLLASGECSPSSSCAGSRTDHAGSGSCDRANQEVPRRPLRTVDPFFGRAPPRLQSGRSGQESFTNFLRVVGRIHDPSLRESPNPPSCSRDFECVDSEVWVPATLPRGSVGYSEDMGYTGASATPLAHAGVCRACFDHYGFMLELVQICGDVGPRVLWAIEALREYQFEAARCVTPPRAPSRRCDISASGSAQNAAQSRKATTCSCRRTGPRVLGGNFDFLSAYVLPNLAWIPEGFSDEIGSNSESGAPS